VPAELVLELVVRNGVVVASFAGELDRADTDALREKLLDALTSGAHGLVCDLSSLSYIDSAGVHLLHRLSRALQADGHRIALILPADSTPRRVLELVGITEAIPVFASLDDAVTGLQQGYSPSS
jgi:anti-sigma B factor antagonist